MEIEEIKKKLRKEYGFFECPKKSDRIFLTEDQWAQIDWTEEEKFINAALPHKLWNMRHDDHFWPWCKKFRGEDAIGYRAGEGHQKYAPRLPQLVRGRGISRWMAEGDKSVAEIPLLADYAVEWTPDNLPEIIEWIERNPGHPRFNQEERWTKKNFLNVYAPSSIQKFSKRSYLERFPKHVSFHQMLIKREEVGKTKDETGEDLVAFVRNGCRWDSYDSYMILDAKYAGLHWN